MAYRHRFRSVWIHKMNAYTFIKLLRSPYSSPFLSTSIYHLELNGDDDYWDIVEPTLLRLSKMNVSSRSLAVTLYHTPKRLAKKHLVALHPEHLSLICAVDSKLELSSFLRFIDALQSLSSLSIDFGQQLPPPCVIEYPGLTLSPALETLAYRVGSLGTRHSGTHRLDFLTWMLNQHPPRLARLNFLIPDPTKTEIGVVQAYLQHNPNLIQFGIDLRALLSKGGCESLESCRPPLVSV